MSLFAEEVVGSGFAIFFTRIVLLATFGRFLEVADNVARVPHDAAKQGLFLSWFGAGRVSSENLPMRSLAVMGILAAAACFLQLEVLIKGMLTTILVMQCIGQAVGVIIYRSSHQEVDRKFRVPLFPLPNIICILGFHVVLATTDNWLFCGLTLFLLVGGVLTSHGPRLAATGHSTNLRPALHLPSDRVNAEDTVHSGHC